MSFNTAISALMVLTNHLAALPGPPPRAAVAPLALMLAPFAPHLAEECWARRDAGPGPVGDVG